LSSTPITNVRHVAKEVSTDTDNLQPAITKVKKLAIEDNQKIKRRSAPVDEVRVGDGTLASHPLIGQLLPIPTAMMNAVSIFRLFTRLFLGERRTGFTLMADALPRERWILTAGVVRRFGRIVPECNCRAAPGGGRDCRAGDSRAKASYHVLPRSGE